MATLFKDLFTFLTEHKKWWLTPIIMLFVLIVLLLVIGGISALLPYLLSGDLEFKTGQLT
ncbi:MAG: hypothetical protein KDE26_26390 [Bacteroidetes bacterium]|nr:hypothetical protein [Bacteroidota bacterium]